MRALVLGGTGCMGIHLINILVGSGWNVTVTTRRNREKSKGIDYIIGNAHDEMFLFPLLNQCFWDVIVDFMVYGTDEFRRRATLLLNATNQYVYMSSARVYAESNTPIKEDSPRLLDVCNDESYLATDEYALAKARQEDILKNSGRKNWTIIRPYITFSEIRLQLSPLEKEFWLYRALKGRTIVFSKDLASKYTTITYGYDVAMSIFSIIGKKEALGEAFHITSNECYRWEEILKMYIDAIKNVTGNEPKVKLADCWESWMGGFALQVKWDRLYDRCFDNSKINNFIETVKFRPVKQAINDCISAFVNTPLFNSISWESEMKKDIFTGEWENIRNIKGIKHKIKYLVFRIGLLSI